MSERCDVVIVGAGPTGLMAAGLLARFGVAVRIFDKSPGPAKESRAFAVQARTMELALFMGLAERFLDRSFIPGGIDVVVDGSPSLSLTFDDIGPVDTPFAFPVMLPQSETEAILIEDIERLGVKVDYGATVTAISQDQDGTTAAVERGSGREEVRAAYLIGADGAHSLVRKALKLSFEGAAYPQDFFLADCKIDWPFARDRLCILFHERQFAAYFPLKGSTYGRVIATAPGDTDPSESVEHQGSHAASLEEVARAVQDAAQADVKLSDPLWTSRYRVHHRGVDRYSVGRIFVAGDAAHIHSPAGGQGMNTGLQDAANLAWKLAAVLKGAAPPALLDTYHDERWPVGQKVLQRTDRMFTAVTSQSRLTAGLRNAALPYLGRAMMRSQTVRATAFRFVSQLGIRYKPGPFVADDLSPDAAKRLDRHLRAGSRAPDGRITRTMSVFDLLEAGRFHLLALCATPLDDAALVRHSTALADLPESVAGVPCGRTLVARSLLGRDPRLTQAESNEVFAHYGVGRDAPEALVLVRPDGYIAYRSDRLDFAALRVFLRRFDTPTP